MKKWTTFAVLILCAKLMSAQYTVLKNEGNVQFNATTISTGTNLTDSVLLQFNEDNARLLLLNDSLNLFWAESPFEPEWPLAECLSPYDKGGHRGFRRKEQAVKDLKFYFGTSNFTVWGDSLSILLDESVYPLNSKQFIIFYYKINGVQQSKKVAFAHQKLILRKEDLFSGKGQSHRGETLKKVNVYLYESETKSSKKITAFDLSFISKEKIGSELGVFKKLAQQNSIEQTVTDTKIEKYIANFYGNTDPKQLNTLLQKSP